MEKLKLFRKLLFMVCLFCNLLYANDNDAIFEYHGVKLRKLSIDKDLEAIEKACNSGYTLACKKLAFAYEEGTKTIKKDLNKFVYYINKMCEQEDYKACQLVGKLYLGYIDIKKDNKKSYKSFKSACVNANLDDSCFFVARFEKLGLGGAQKNPFQSERTFKRLCRKNHKKSCIFLKDFDKTLNTKTNRQYLEEKIKFEQRQQAKNYAIDPQTNLMWQDEIDTNTIKRNFNGALKYCNELEMGGYDDWRLPNASELFSLVDENKRNNTNSIIKYSSLDIYISSTFHSKKNQNIWFLWFKNPLFKSIGGLKGKHYVRCVRGKELLIDRKKFYIPWQEK